MHVAKLFDPFRFCEDVEVVVAPLPELNLFRFKPLGGFALEDAECVLEASGLRIPARRRESERARA